MKLKVFVFGLFLVGGVLFFTNNVKAESSQYGCCCAGSGSNISCSVIPLSNSGMSGADGTCPGGLGDPVYRGNSESVQASCNYYAVSQKAIALDDKWCFCYLNSNPSKRTGGQFTPCESGNKEKDPSFCEERTGYDGCSIYDTQEQCQRDLTLWQKENNLLGTEATQSSFIPNCAFYDVLSPECRDINIFVVMLINIGKYLFAIVGALVLLMLILGGFQLIISQGNPDKIKTAKDIILGAVIGLFVVFGAYALVDFLGDTLGVKEPLDINPATTVNQSAEAKK